MDTETCTKCGKEYPYTAEYFVRHQSYRTGLSRRCRICDREYHKEHWKERRERELLKRRKKIESFGAGNHHYFRVIRDPDEQGGYPRGARLDSYNLRLSLDMGHMTPGTIIESEQGTPYKIIGSYYAKQKMVREGEF